MTVHRASSMSRATVVLRYRVPIAQQRDFAERMGEIARATLNERHNRRLSDVSMTLLQPVFGTEPPTWELHIDFPSLQVAGFWVDHLHAVTLPPQVGAEMPAQHIFAALRSPVLQVELVTSEALPIYRSIELAVTDKSPDAGVGRT
ncbi:hypothetical protein IEZ26_04550 [Nocardioides cavernae]|uniref:Uncharacterized protein n=1 Tax=Nocardioides cavernae TaxID=1921566 RepID=A0ABR8N6V8_9ACTN|nr:hypothetical protein [Nocardioides cavernae]MBD3923882.1 hypothetical protein [Nocardioides cavernae]MBM7511182.1 hypothetical protein [Nocardioides cavernae]